MTENNSFVSFDNNELGLLFDDSNHPNYPIRYYNVISCIKTCVGPDSSIKDA